MASKNDLKHLINLFSFKYLCANGINKNDTYSWNIISVVYKNIFSQELFT